MRKLMREAKEVEGEVEVEARSFFSEFKEFAAKGNVVDLAIGVVIGTAFGKVVSSLVADIITPLLGVVLGHIDLKNLTFAFPAIPGIGDRIVLPYGDFLQNTLDFIIIAFALFLVIRILSRLKRRFEHQQKTGEAPKPQDIALLEEIRDLLKKETRG